MKNLTLSTENDLENFIKSKKYMKVFVISGKKSYTISGASHLLKKILKKKIVKFYLKNSSYPEISELKKIVFSIKDFLPDLILAVGGGSVIDYGKIANVVQNITNLEKHIINSSFKFKKKYTQLVAIPTTAGSGAEVTSNAVIYIDKIKYSLENKLIKPDRFFLIPELVVNSSKKIKAAAGFDAIAQAVESLISKKSNYQSAYYAKKSLNISLKYYLEYLKRPNIENSTAMCLAANLAGKAINISKTTAPHAVSYPFASLYGLSHGHAVSLTIEKFLKFNYVNHNSAKCNFDLQSRYKNIFEIFKVKNILELEKLFIDMKSKANLIDDFKKLKINLNTQLDKIIDGVNLQRLRNNPVDLNKKDVKTILLGFN